MVKPFPTGLIITVNDTEGRPVDGIGESRHGGMRADQGFANVRQNVIEYGLLVATIVLVILLGVAKIRKSDRTMVRRPRGPT